MPRHRTPLLLLIELDAIERIGSSVRRVHSAHVLAAGEEIVLDEYAPVAGSRR